MNVNKVDIYVDVIKIKSNEKKKFGFIALQVQNNLETEYFYLLEERTKNRALILGTHKFLNESSSLNAIIHFPSNVGIGYMNNMLKNKNCNKWINKDVA